MSKIQPTPRYSLTRGTSAARAINANRVPSPRALAVVAATTVEIEGESSDIIVRPGKHGVLILVRSTIAPTRCCPVN